MLDRVAPLTSMSKVSIVLLVGCLAGCAAGSCLSYGHSCWGAHGKRSSNDIQDSRWFISRLAPISTRLQHQPDSAQWFARPPQEEDELRKQPPMGETSLLVPAEPEFPPEDAPDDREVIVMEQPPRIYKILNRPTNKLEFKTSSKK